jgi:Protein of unknown function (DUF3551)
MVPAVLTQTPALCPTIILGGPPNIRGTAGGGTNCGFFTIEQCRATVSGIGGFCVPNQFYNPCGSAGSPQLSVSVLTIRTSHQLLALPLARLDF